VAILLGPWSAVIAVSVALAIQALLFGDGGIIALAANCFNIAFVGPLVGYAVYRFVILWQWPSNFSAIAAPGCSSRSPNLVLDGVAAGVGSYAGVNAAALMTAIELGIQPLITAGGYSPYGLKVVLPAIMIPHLTMVGILEATVTILVVSLLRKTNVNIVKAVQPLVLVAAALFVLPTASASAHDYWLEQKGGELMLVFGHGSQRLDFEFQKVKSVKAIDAQGNEIPVQKEQRGKVLQLKLKGQPAVVTAEVDNGYWSKTIYGWKELPKRKASRVVEAIRQLFYTKTIIAWPEGGKTGSTGAGLEILLLQNPFILKAGDPASLQFLFNGKPLSGAEIGGLEHATFGKTDKDGLIKAPIAPALNLITVEHRERIKDDPDADILDLTATLTFEVKK